MTSRGPFPPVHAPVKTMMVYLTEACNLRCSYCWVRPKPRHMSVDTLRKAVDFLLDRNVSSAQYQVSINFFGGEPFLRIGLMEEAVAYARRYRPNVYKTVRFSATTNGTIAGPRVERLLRDSAMDLLVSLDGGPSGNIRRTFPSGRCSHGLVARNLPRLIAWARDVSVRMTFLPETLDLVDSVKSVLEFGPSTVVLSPAVEVPWSGHEEALEEAYQALADFYIGEARRGQAVPLEITNRFLRDVHRSRRGTYRPSRPCSAGSRMIGVDPDGNVMPCHRFLYRHDDWMGTVDSPVMADVRWRYVHLSSHDIVGCDGCMARSICGGGCRAATLQAGEGLYGAHPAYCLTTRAHARAVHRIYDTLSAEQNGVLARVLASVASGDC